MRTSSMTPRFDRRTKHALSGFSPSPAKCFVAQHRASWLVTSWLVSPLLTKGDQSRGRCAPAPTVAVDQLAAPVPRKRCNRQNSAARIGGHGTRRWGALTEACHVPLDRRGTPRTCHPMADKFGAADCRKVAPPARRDMPEGNAAGAVVARSSPNISTSICESRGRS